ncbi:D-glycero-alpha-D-manno-heptose-1,7-bisphosphate 7-phosphatase [Cesiribacter andamanensis]|uniref:D,D-heptose 1,7-bisphosphate phosphatase n=1 Tax=Cesiribacter andamanensis AMV16 TaxID=1279009 RepID=M7NXN6_9BACT|nr:HAD family hydrolase [Cesiribacter andamanensis]EMR03159.1 D,D-heptose 1,7-bisphosphate phosphatase [Cesiribacter andamanensis AMV16]
MQKCVFLDRDGVINKDYVDYVYSADKLELLPGVEEALQALKQAGFLLIVITNQSGIAKGIYTREQMHETHRLIQQALGGTIDHFYYAPWHPSVSNCLTRKPGSLLFERAIARYKVDAGQSWMVGDKDRDLIPAKKVGLKTIQVEHADSPRADHKVADLRACLPLILDESRG